MLEQLNKKQESLMKKISDKWIKNFYSGKGIDYKKVTKGINMMYKLCGYKNPKIIYLSSPLGLQMGANMLWDNVRDNVENNVENNVRNNVENNVWNNVRDNVWDNVRNNVRDNVENNVRDNMWDNVRNNVENNVRNNVWNKKMKFFTFCSFGDFSDSDWVAFYDYFQEIGLSLGISEKKFNIFKDMIYGGVYNMIQFEKVCFVSELPIHCFKDERKRLHNTKGPAIEWRDGYKIYCIDGQILEEEMFDKIVNDRLSVEELLAIENNDTRAVAYEYFDKNKFSNIESKTLDEKIDGKGNIMKIIEMDLKNMGKVRYYVGICPSTKKTHYLATTQDTCELAKARSFGLKKAIQFTNEF